MQSLMQLDVDIDVTMSMRLLQTAQPLNCGGYKAWTLFETRVVVVDTGSFIGICSFESLPSP